jgi:hypothetical protein
MEKITNMYLVEDPDDATGTPYFYTDEDFLTDPDQDFSGRKVMVIKWKPTHRIAPKVPAKLVKL